MSALAAELRDPPFTRDTAVTAYALLSKPSGMLGQAACRRKEEKESSSGPRDGQCSTINVHACKKIKLVSSICCVC